MDVVLPKPGRYVIAVSGGVDSMALLDILRRQAGLELAAAHFDHGIRQDSAEDRRLAEAVAAEHGLPFVYREGGLGPGASEAKARTARYDFLRQVQRDHGARAVITAHHQDDVLETAIINLLRGTGRKGLTALNSRPGLVRPLLGVPKTELLEYARTEGLRWREDPTNRDLNYLRNYVRHRILARFGEADRARLLDVLTKLTVTNRELDAALGELLNMRIDGTLERQPFNGLPHAVAREVMAAWLRAAGAGGFDSKTLERLVVAAKTGAAGKTFPVQAGFNMEIHTGHLALAVPER